MARLDLRGRVLLAIGAGGVLAAACGGTEDGTGGVGADASGDRPVTFEAGEAASTEAGREAAVESGPSTEGGDGPVLNDAPIDGVLADVGPEVGAEGSVEGGDDAEAGDGAGDGPSLLDAVGDALSADVIDASSLDAGAEACAQYGQACTQSSDCCNGVPCSLGAGPCPDAGELCTCHVSIRRPFLVGRSLRVATAAPRTDWLLEGDALPPAPGLDRVTAQALARDWLRDACDEHASIAAFARFTMHLASVGAPPEMIEASQRAAIDEVRHALACFALARRYGGQAMGPAALSIEGALTPMSLAEIAALTAEEGCVGETLGVLLAEEQLAKTTDPAVRAALVRADIVADEARHTELAWSFVSWAIARGGEPVRRAVAVAVRRAIDATLAMPIVTYEGVDEDAWRAHGRLTCADARVVAERGVREVLDPSLQALLGGRPEAVRSVLPARA